MLLHLFLVDWAVGFNAHRRPVLCKTGYFYCCRKVLCWGEELDGASVAAGGVENNALCGEKNDRQRVFKNHVKQICNSNHVAGLVRSTGKAGELRPRSDCC